MKHRHASQVTLGAANRAAFEALFAINVALAAMSKMTSDYLPLEYLFARMETRIKAFFHIRQTDLIYGHVAAWIPSIGLALLIWLTMRATRRAVFTRKFLQTAAGVITICLPLLFWATPSSPGISRT